MYVLTVTRNIFCTFFGKNTCVLFQRSHPSQHGPETSKSITNVNKQSSSENNATLVQHKPEGMFDCIK